MLYWHGRPTEHGPEHFDAVDHQSRAAPVKISKLGRLFADSFLDGLRIFSPSHKI
jgi:hypothetical protein